MPKIGSHQYTTSSHSTTLESNKSVGQKVIIKDLTVSSSIGRARSPPLLRHALCRLAPITRRKPSFVHCTVHTLSTDVMACRISRSDTPSRARCLRGLTRLSYGHTVVEARHLSTTCAVACTAPTNGGIVPCINASGIIHKIRVHDPPQALQINSYD